MFSSLIFDDIIMGIISNNEFPHPTEEKYCLFTQIDNNIVYMYRGSLQDFYWRKGTYECLEIKCVHCHLKKNDMKYYLTHILKMTLQVVIWMKRYGIVWIPLKTSTRSILLCLHYRLKKMFLEESLFVTVWSPPGLII